MAGARRGRTAKGGSSREKVKIVIIGAGSGFGRAALADIMSNKVLGRRDCTVSLVDVDEAALKEMAALGEMIRKHYRSGVRIERTTDRTKALAGADFVIISVAIKRYELWEQDYRVPMAFGFGHALGENGGPGGLFHALRNFELVIPICRDIERLCPGALVLNFTNPESRIVMAATELTGVRMVGLCHGVLQARQETARLLGRELETLRIVIGGLNHFFWVLRVEDAATGKDLYGRLRKRVREACPPLVRKMVEVFGCFTYPSDDHIGEYVSFAPEFTGGLWHYGQESRAVPRVASARGNWRERFLSGEKGLKDLVSPSGEIEVDIIANVVEDGGGWVPAVNVRNDGLYVENLPAEAVVEVSATVDAAGVHPERVGPLPEALAALCRTQVSIQRLLVEAYRRRSRKLLLQALLLDPVVNHAGRAEEMLDYMLRLQKDYLPRFGA